MSTQKTKIGVLGASGYTGGELLRLLAAHPYMEVTAVTADKAAGATLSSVFPYLASVLPPLTLEPVDVESIAARVDAVFLALPHTKSLTAVAAFLRAEKHVVDLSADYRLKNAAEYERWYQIPHTHPEILKDAVYGLPELYRQDIQKTRMVASPGCYPTAAILQLAPLAARGFIQPGSIVIDAKSGVSGAGRSPALAYHFPEAHESLEAYKIGQHRHIPEIEQELHQLNSRSHADTSTKHDSDMSVIFTPHLVPMNRGILSTAYCKLKKPISLEELRGAYRDYYKNERFIRLMNGETSPNPRHVRGANFCDLNVFLDTRAGWVVTVAALDNLIKGAAGQALQAMNLMLGYPEETGLTSAGVFP